MTSQGEVPRESFGRATVFESGYAHGFAQFEVERIAFETRLKHDSSTYPVAVFVRRGRRKEEPKDAVRLVVVEGWDLPTLETDIVKHSANAVVRSAKFPAFSPGWDSLLDEYLQGLGPTARVILDGRSLKQRAGRNEAATLSPAPAAVAQGASLPAPAFSEGAPTELLLTRYERDPQARRACLEHYGSACQVCGVNMGEVYGPGGEGFIHVHHRVPLSEIGAAYVVDPIRDLVPVCPNCHAMLHQGPTVLAVETLRRIVDERRR